MEKLQNVWLAMQHAKHATEEYMFIAGISEGL
jgi:hypothetical protein